MCVYIHVHLYICRHTHINMHTENSIQLQQPEYFSSLRPILVSLCKIRHLTSMPQKTAPVFLIMALGIQFSEGFFLERTECIQAFTADANPHPPTDLRGNTALCGSWRPWWAQAGQWGEWNLFGWFGFMWSCGESGCGEAGSEELMERECRALPRESIT